MTTRICVKYRPENEFRHVLERDGVMVTPEPGKKIKREHAAEILEEYGLKLVALNGVAWRLEIEVK